MSRGPARLPRSREERRGGAQGPGREKREAGHSDQAVRGNFRPGRPPGEEGGEDKMQFLEDGAGCWNPTLCVFCVHAACPLTRPCSHCHICSCSTALAVHRGEAIRAVQVETC